MMEKTAQQPEKSQAADCVEEMEALSREIETAVAAIAANRLPAFEESLGKQAHQAARCQAVLFRSAPLFANDVRLRHAARSLHKATDKYAALLLHAGQSLEMLTVLHRSASGDGKWNRAERCGSSWQG